MARGRKSKEKEAHGVGFVRPAHLTPEAAAEWDRIVTGQAPNWFVTGAEILLEAYVEAVVYIRHLHKTRRLMAADPENKPGDLVGISEGIAAEGRNLIQLARQLRLTQQSRIAPKTTSNEPLPPWLEGDDDDEEGTG